MYPFTNILLEHYKDSLFKTIETKVYIVYEDKETTHYEVIHVKETLFKKTVETFKCCHYGDALDKFKELTK